MGTKTLDKKPDENEQGDIYVSDVKGARFWQTGTPKKAREMNLLGKGGDDLATFFWKKTSSARD